MLTEPRTPSIQRLLLAGACLIVIIAGIKAAADLLNPILVAIFFTILCSPLYEWLRKRKLPGWLTLLIIVGGMLVILLALIGFVGVSVSQVSNRLPAYQQTINNQLAALDQQLGPFGVKIGDLSLQRIGVDRVVQFTLAFLSNLADAATGIGVMLFIFAFMLGEAPAFGARLRRVLGANSPVPQRLIALEESLGKYMTIRVWLGLLAAVLNTVLLLILGVDFSLLWGVISFLFSFVPNVGFLISIIPPILVALAEQGLVAAILVVVGYAAINTVVDNVIGPRFLGEGLNLSSTVTFLSVLFWAWIFGGIGAILALPLTIFLQKVVLESFPETRWLAQLLGSANETEPAEKPSTSAEKGPSSSAP
jgi:predicted PurR-regulated permease PerM